MKSLTWMWNGWASSETFLIVHSSVVSSFGRDVDARGVELLPVDVELVGLRVLAEHQLPGPVDRIGEQRRRRRDRSGPRDIGDRVTGDVDCGEPSFGVVVAGRAVAVLQGPKFVGARVRPADKHVIPLARWQHQLVGRPNLRDRVGVLRR